MRGIVAAAAAVALAGGAAFVGLQAHADEAPAKVDTSKLPPLKDWPSKSPYTGNADAISIGAQAYNENCARCHGLEMISGGIAPDLRKVPADQEGDDLFTERMHKGAQRNGVTMMPVFYGLLPNEELWAIRAFMISKNIPE
jgi:cytochrome c-550 PedF